MLCPELSSFRVGKVVLYDPISLRIILLPVQEYPITTEENEDKDEPDMLVDLSPYKEDGSLEIEYSSLLDVRLLKGIKHAMKLDRHWPKEGQLPYTKMKAILRARNHPWLQTTLMVKNTN
ncbi:Coilin [Zea mays]|uniref:Coilin n=1 Tax=Zea mays TaxID=4577 RepID=A0A1D6EC13_MAIZE|nr:Coilin [Zea mays]